MSRSNRIFDVIVAITAPSIWPRKKPRTFEGCTPANVSDRARAIVMAGLAKLVDEVHQYPATIAKATAVGTDFGACLIAPKIANTKVNVANPSAKILENPDLSVVAT